MAGVPFEIIERLRTPETISSARELLARQEEYAKARADVERFFQSRERLLSEEAFRSLRTAFRLHRPPTGVTGEQPSFFINYAAATAAIASAESNLNSTLARELAAARQELWNSSRKFLPGLLAFGVGGVHELLNELLGSSADNGSALPRRNSRAGERERHLLLYLQRVAAKNDAFSEFGPTGWGKIDIVPAELKTDIRPGIAAREVFWERWAAHVIAAAMNADPEIFPELSPRLNPNGRIDDSKFVFTDSGESVELDSSQSELLRCCDGLTPVHALPAPMETIRALVETKVLRCEMEVPALEPHAFEILHDDVANWRPGAAHERWMSILQPLAELSKNFAQSAETKVRDQILQEAHERLQKLGATRKTGERFLYSATNPIGEECFRECGFSIDEKLINEVAIEAAPWIDLWRDSYAFVASRVAAGLRGVLEKMSIQNGAAPLPAFLRACETAKLPLTGPGLVALAHIAFQEVKTAFREMMNAHANKAEHELTADDCHLVRKNFSIQSSTNTLIPRPICRCPRDRPKRSRPATTNGFSRNCIRPSLCCITALTGVVPDKGIAQPGLRANNRRQTKFSFWILRRRFHFAHRPFGFSMRSRIFQTLSRRREEIQNGAPSRRPTRKFMSMKRAAMFVCARSVRTNISARSRVPG